MKTNKSGFTLIELLVSTSLFAILVLLAAGTFIYILKSQRNLAAQGTVQQDGQFVVEKMVKVIRRGIVDYDYYSDNSIDLSNAVNVLALQVPEILYRAENNILQQSINGGTDWFDLTSSSVDINRLDFFIVPVVDPNDSGDFLQPRVTIIMELVANDQILVLQQTIPQRFSEIK